MKAIPFQKARFVLPGFKKSDFPNTQMPEIALCGRSNVGKSSLINHLLRCKGLAKVSSTPGKTQSVNFFNIDEALMLVDLPGYGFAKTSKRIQDDWAVLIDDYLNNRPQLKLLLILIDLRRPELSIQDRLLVQWAEKNSLDVCFIFTKADKIRPRLFKKTVDNLKQHIEETTDVESIDAITYTINSATGRTALIAHLNERIMNGNLRLSRL